MSAIPDFVYAFDTQRRFVFANPAMLALFGLSADELRGKNFAELGYPDDLADRLNTHIDVILNEGVTVEDEVYFRSPTGYGAYFAFLWGPVRAEDGSVELVVGVSRDTTERRVMEEALKKNPDDIISYLLWLWDTNGGLVSDSINELDNKEFPDWNPRKVEETLAELLRNS